MAQPYKLQHVGLAILASRTT